MYKSDFDKLMNDKPKIIKSACLLESSSKDGLRVACMRTEKIDENGRKILPSGIEFPAGGMPLLLEHGFSARGYMPIGRVERAWLESDGRKNAKSKKLMCEYRFASEGVSEASGEVERMVEDKLYTHGSITVRPDWDTVEWIQSSKEDDDGYLFVPNSLAIEFSIVSAEADHGAALSNSIQSFIEQDMTDQEYNVILKAVMEDITSAKEKEEEEEEDKEESTDDILKILIDRVKNIESMLNGMKSVDEGNKTAEPKDTVESYLSGLLDDGWSPKTSKSSPQSKDDPEHDIYESIINLT